MDLRQLESLALEGKKVLIRLDLNVPIRDGAITDETRISAALPTIKYVAERTNRFALCSHLGRPKGKKDPKYTLEPVGLRLAELLEREVVFIQDYDREPAEQVLNQLSNDQFILLENLRFFPGETNNDVNFAREVMTGFDIYVNDAFGTAHRAHASTVAMAECVEPSERAAGFLIQKETEALSGVMTNPKAPFTVIMGGAKVSDKIAVILSLLERCNHLLIGGAMAYTFLKYKGVDVGSSRVEDDRMDMVKTIYENADKRRVQIHLPVDHIAAESFSESARPIPIAGESFEGANVMGLDIGPKSISAYTDVIGRSETILWNGPMGVFEWDHFSAGTFAVAEAMASSSGQTVIGGGDSVAAANKAGLSDRMTHISTGGGASLEYLEGKVLPGLKVLYR